MPRPSTNQPASPPVGSRVAAKFTFILSMGPCKWLAGKDSSDPTGREPVITTNHYPIALGEDDIYSISHLQQSTGCTPDIHTIYNTRLLSVRLDGQISAFQLALLQARRMPPELPTTDGSDTFSPFLDGCLTSAPKDGPFWSLFRLCREDLTYSTVSVGNFLSTVDSLLTSSPTQSGDLPTLSSRYSAGDPIALQ
ncbi:hypothetical protein CIHG_09606 [Coccidioides immitis H538.4]|uniref:Uncharacterized protein n=2 Tax=Coccidioides immitis TaxID=5501 RepID=A0A0J8S3Y4_COCIT|nr:hypothetical protein CIRG_03901 [Coccidioides immitis RMSCC 2394]KMU91867.1 hypothetical protein CIHG_09606 [Coccidioides immitis H538.4]